MEDSNTRMNQFLHNFYDNFYDNFTKLFSQIRNHQSTILWTEQMCFFTSCKFFHQFLINGNNFAYVFFILVYFFFWHISRFNNCPFTFASVQTICFTEKNSKKCIIFFCHIKFRNFFKFWSKEITRRQLFAINNLLIT